MSGEDFDERDDPGLWGLGAATTISGSPPRGWRPPVREFPIGFHVAAPGASHEEPAPKRGRPVPKKP